HREARLAVIELAQDIVDLAVAAGFPLLRRRRWTARMATRDLPRIDVGAQALKDRSAQRVVIGPALKRDFRDELRLAPDGRAVKIRLFGERTLVRPQRFETKLELRQIVSVQS